MEKQWTNFKYSVNNEENKDNEEDIDRNIVQSEQLVTQMQNNNGVTLKTSESTTCENSSERPQLAAKTTTTNTEQKRASKSAANKGKSIIPACKLCLSNRFNGSLVKTDSSKELGTPDNTSRNTIFRQRYNPLTNTYHNLKTLKNLIKTNNPYTLKDV